MGRSNDTSGGSKRLEWRPYQIGQGSVSVTNGRICLEKGISSGDTYSNAQIDDYQTLSRRDFFWKPPLKLSLCARFSHPAPDPANHAKPLLQHTSQSQNNSMCMSAVQRGIAGTAGFGFWNDPFMMTGRRSPTLPRALWFFYSSSPSDMQLAYGIQGWGWKAAVIDCLRPPFYLLLPTAPIGVLLMHSQLLYRLLWPIAQRAMHVQEKLLSHPMELWHHYELEWLPNEVKFWIDGELVFYTSCAPRGPLGLVIWLDNQFMIVRPTGVIRSGLVANEERERLEISNLTISRITSQ